VVVFCLTRRLLHELNAQRQVEPLVRRTPSVAKQVRPGPLLIRFEANCSENFFLLLLHHRVISWTIAQLRQDDRSSLRALLVPHEPSRGIREKGRYDQDVDSEDDLKKQWKPPLDLARVEVEGVVDPVRQQ
jgi:hypothetical protein